MKFSNFEDVIETNEVYFLNNRISQNKEEVVLEIDEDMVFETRYGYGIYLVNNKVLFIQNWQLSLSHDGETEVYLNKKYFNPTNATKDVDSFVPDTWEAILLVAGMQEKQALWLKRGVYLR